MSTKLSPLEELQLEKVKLQEECVLRKERLQGRVEYAKNNFGNLILRSAFSSTKSGISDALSIFSGKKIAKTSKSSSGIGAVLLSMTPFVWDMVQPMIFGMFLKKVKSAFTRKKKKKSAN